MDGAGKDIPPLPRSLTVQPQIKNQILSELEEESEGKRWGKVGWGM